MQSKVDKNRADALGKAIEGFIAALETAGTLAGNPHLASAADQLIKEAKAEGQTGQEQTPQGGQNGEEQ